MSLNFIQKSFQITTNSQIRNTLTCITRSSSHLLHQLPNYDNRSQLFKINYPSLVAHVSTSTAPSESNGIFKKLMKRVGWAENSKSKLRVLSSYLYESVADQINYLEFFEKYDLPDTFNSWFLVTELHVWMLMVRVMSEGSENGEDGRFLRNSIVEIMWADVNARAKKLGSDNPSAIRKHIQLLSQQFQAALITYDEGIMSDDKILASALWRRFFNKNCDDYKKLELLVQYVRKQMHHFDNISKNDFLNKPEIRWIQYTPR